VVLLFGFLFSISAAFEIQLKSDFTSDKLCKSTRSQAVENATTYSQPGDNAEPLNLVRQNDSDHNFNEDEMMSQHRLERSLDNDVLSNSTNDDNSPKLNHKTSHNPADADHYVNDAQRDNTTTAVIPEPNHNTCSVSDFYRHLRRIVVIVGLKELKKKRGKTPHMTIKVYGRLGIFSIVKLKRRRSKSFY
jgi:hypothetical protein